MTTIELALGAPAAGGGVVARDDAGRVVFVRHGLPGERVRAVLTEERAAWARADAVEVIEASSDRVVAPCPYARPDGCGGCDYQHVALGAQRELKRALLESQLRRVAGVEAHVEVRAVGDGDGLATRTRVRYAVSAAGHLAMRRHRSHELIDVEHCALEVATIASLGLSGREWAAGDEVEAMALGGALPATVVVTHGGAREERSVPHEVEVLVGDGLVTRQETEVLGERYVVSPGVFWQVHDHAPALLVAEVMAGLELHEGDRVLDLYCGVGLFTKPIARAVGERGAVVGIDSSREATRDARENVAGLPWARIVTSGVTARSVREAVHGASHAVFDPPRRGVDRGALAQLLAAASVRRVVSVSCDPSTFSRDLRLMLDAGFHLVELKAFDLFEMTEHMECVAVLER